MPSELITGNHAAATAATLAARANARGRGFGSGVYPITPQTECIELLCKQEIAKGHVVRVESEHSAMAVCIGFALGGARTFTASSSNGLAYMAENVFAAAYYRLPVVMMAVNRTLGPPWNIWVDHGDTLMLRDGGWIQLYCEDNQEVFDSVLAAYRLAEDSRVLLPVLVCQDAFVLSHTMMPTEVARQEEVDAFLPPLRLPHRLDSAPRTIGGLDFPHEAEVHRRQLQEAMERVPAVYREVQDAFAACFGRPLPPPVVPHRMEDAEVALVCMGTTASTARQAVDQARRDGIAAGMVRVRMFRPLPAAELRAALAPARRVAIVDRDLSPGLGGILWSEVLPLVASGAVAQGYLSGLGGGDVLPAHLRSILDQTARLAAAGPPIVQEVG